MPTNSLDVRGVAELPSDIPLAGNKPLSYPRKARLATEIFGAYLLVRRLVARRELPAVLSRLRRAPSFPDADYMATEHIRALRLGWAVRRTLSSLPLDSRCLMQSLVLTRLLARRRIQSSLVIGVAPGDRFGAHAWIEYCGQPVLPTSDLEGQQLARL